MSLDDIDWDESEDWPDDDDGESLTVTCRACGEQVYEDAEQCPYCHEYIAASHTVWDGRPSWWIILGGLGIVATIVALSGF